MTGWLPRSFPNFWASILMAKAARAGSSNFFLFSFARITRRGSRSRTQKAAERFHGISPGFRETRTNLFRRRRHSLNSRRCSRQIVLEEAGSSLLESHDSSQRRRSSVRGGCFGTLQRSCAGRPGGHGRGECSRVSRFIQQITSRIWARWNSCGPREQNSERLRGGNKKCLQSCR